MLALFMVVIVVVVVVAAAAMVLLHLCQLRSGSGIAFHSLNKLRTGQFAPGCRDDGSFCIALPKQFHSLVQLFLRNRIGTGKDHRGSSLHLVVIELTKVLHIHLYLTGIGHRHLIAHRNIVTHYFFHSRHNIGQLAHTGGLNDHTVRMVFTDDLFQCFAEVTHQAAANTAGVHLRNVDAGILQEAAVNTDLTKFVFDEHQFLAAVALRDHFFDQCRLAGAQKSGINIDLSHKKHLLFLFFPE